MDISNLMATVPVSLKGRNIQALSQDSRNVPAGSLFFAMMGMNGVGADYMRAAIACRPVAVVMPRADVAQAQAIAGDVPLIASDDIRRDYARACAAFYGQQPSTIVAVTGTSGKSSVVDFARQMWISMNIDAASMGTVGIMTKRHNQSLDLTTPDAAIIHQHLQQMAQEGVTHLAMEASSHGIDQRRLDGVHIAAAGFTNLSRDHLDYHPTMDDYFAAKMRLFAALLPSTATAVINTMNEWGHKAVALVKSRRLKCLTIDQQAADIQLQSYVPHDQGAAVELRVMGQPFAIDFPLLGEWQLHNALMAAGLLIASGSDVATTVQALTKLQSVPGRLQLIGRHPHTHAPVFVDYAHKPEALEKVLQVLRPLTAKKLHVVFGCGGNRDKGKRPIMGRIADQLADVVVVTDDNPRKEDAATIRAEIIAASPRAQNIGDRRLAIEQAIAVLHEGDVLVVCGKGHEKGQIVGTDVLPFNDAEEVMRCLNHLATSVRAAVAQGRK